VSLRIKKGFMFNSRLVSCLILVVGITVIGCTGLKVCSEASPGNDWSSTIDDKLNWLLYRTALVNENPQNEDLSKAQKKEPAEPLCILHQAQKKVHQFTQKNRSFILVELYMEQGPRVGDEEGAECGNAYLAQLVLLEEKNKKFRYLSNIPLSGKWFREATIKSISDNNIQIETVSYKDDDPACCPSQKGSVTVKIECDKLVESAIENRK